MEPYFKALPCVYRSLRAEGDKLLQKWLTVPTVGVDLSTHTCIMAPLSVSEDFFVLRNIGGWFVF